MPGSSRLASASVALLAQLSLGLLSSTAFSASMTSTVFGEVVDVTNKDAPVPDAIVVVNSPAAQGDQTALSDDKGHYRIDQLPPGEYVITVNAPGFKEYKIGGVRLMVGREVKVKVEMVPEVITGQTIEVKNIVTSTIDQGSTSTGVTITKDYMERVASARSFEAVTNATPGAQVDTYGISFAGTTSPENAYFVDGQNVQSVASGSMNLNLPLEFFDQVEVKVGGYMPEFGQATGGYINTITKQGSNEIHGSVFSYTTPLRLPAIAIDKAGESIVSATGLDIRQDMGFEVSGAIVKDLLWFHVGFAPLFENDSLSRRLRRLKDAGGGVVATDAKGNELTEDLPRYDKKFGRFTQSYRYSGKLTLQPSENHRFSLTTSGNPSLAQGAIGVYGDESAFAGFSRTGMYTATINYDGKFFDKHLLVDAVVGYSQGDTLSGPLNGNDHRQQIDWSPRLNLTRFEPNTAQDCATPLVDATGKSIARCPVQDYTTGAYGGGQYQREERWTARANAAALFNLLGSHQLKGGIEFMRASLFHRRTINGDYGEQVIQSASGKFYYQEGGFSVPENPNDPADLNVVSKNPWRNSVYYNNYAAYLQDSWTIFDRVNLNGGVRLDVQDMYGGNSPDKVAQIPNVHTLTLSNWSPRVGLIWDFLGNGRSKIFASFARTYELMPLDIFDRSTPNETQVITLRSLCSDATPSNCPAVRRLAYYGGTAEQILSNTTGQYVDRIEFGGEYQVTNDLLLGINYQNQRLGTVIEDYSTDNGNSYFIGNPGPLPASGALPKGIDPITGKRYDVSYTSVDPVTSRNFKVRFPKPERNYDGMNVYATKSLARNWVLQASYTLSFLRGHYSGLFRPEDGQLDPNLGSDFDLVSTLANRYGYLPSDRTHQFKFDAAYIFEVNERFAIIPNIVMRVGSGTPYSYTGPWTGYGVLQVYFTTRGTAGRTDPLFQPDLGIKGEYIFSKSSRLTVGLMFINIGSVQLGTAVDQNFVRADSFARPVAGGDTSDLKHLKDFGGSPVILNPNFGRVIARQQPMEVRVDAKLTF